MTDLNTINDTLKTTNSNLTRINETIAGLKKKRKISVTVIISALSLLVSFYAIYYTVHSSRQSFEQQQLTQAYSYWQRFLALTIQYPDFANGKDTIGGFTIDEISKFDSIAKRKHKTIHDRYVQYVWFVSNALGAAEIVWNLQKGDSGWESTLIEVLDNYKGFYNSNAFALCDYSKDMQDLIKKAMCGKLKQTCP